MMRLCLSVPVQLLWDAKLIGCVANWLEVVEAAEVAEGLRTSGDRDVVLRTFEVLAAWMIRQALHQQMQQRMDLRQLVRRVLDLARVARVDDRRPFAW
jgi:hypothetical protein